MTAIFAHALSYFKGGEKVVRQILRQEVAVSIATKSAPAPKPKPPVLKLVSGAVQLAVIATYDPKELKTRKGLWVSYDFVRLVRSNAKPVANLSRFLFTLAS